MPGGYNQVLMLKIIRRSLSLLLVLASIGLFIWAAIPNQQQRYSQTIRTDQIQIPESEVSEPAVSMSDRQVILEWPSSMRIGEEEQITVSFEPVNGSDRASTEQPGKDSIYDHFSLMAEGRFEVAGIRVSPSEAIRASMPEGQAVKFQWQISTDKAGIYDGRVWLSLRLLPLDGSNTWQVPVFIKEIKLEATSLFGLSETVVNILGGVGLLLAGIIASGDIGSLMRKWQKQSSNDGNQ
jgi:hypothetical protein